jgi:hypothetical protein
LRGWGKRDEAGWVVREVREMTQALYAHMNNNKKRKYSLQKYPMSYVITLFVPIRSIFLHLHNDIF